MAGFLAQARLRDAQFLWLDDLVCRSGYAPVVRTEGDRFLVTLKALAPLFQVSVREVYRWQRAGMPRFRASLGNRPALFDAMEVFRWRRDLEKAEREVGADPLLAGGGPELDEFKARLYAERIREVRRRNDIADGKLINAAEVSQRWALIARMQREAFEALERRYGPEFATEIDALLDRMDAELETLMGHKAPKVQEQPPAAAKPKRKAKKKRKRKRKKPGLNRKGRPLARGAQASKGRKGKGK